MPFRQDCVKILRIFITGSTLCFMALQKKDTFSRGSAASFSLCAELHENQNESVQVRTGNDTNCILVFTLKSDRLFQRPRDRVCGFAETIVMPFGQALCKMRWKRTLN